MPGQSNGEAGAGRDPLRITSGETVEMAGAGGQGMGGGGHMMSPGQPDHLRHQQTAHTGHQEPAQGGDIRQTDNRLGTGSSVVVAIT